MQIRYNLQHTLSVMYAFGVIITCEPICALEYSLRFLNLFVLNWFLFARKISRLISGNKNCSNWCNRIFWVIRYLFCFLLLLLVFSDLLYSLPPYWINHLFILIFCLNSGRLLSLSFNRLCCHSLSPSGGGSTSGNLSWMGSFLHLGLFLIWLLAFLASEDSIISSWFKLRFWGNLHSASDLCLSLIRMQ